MFIIPQETGREWRLTRDSFEDTGVVSLPSRTDTNSDKDKQLVKSRLREPSRAKASHSGAFHKTPRSNDTSPASSIHALIPSLNNNT